MAKKTIGIKPKIDDFVVIDGKYYKKYDNEDGQTCLKSYPLSRIRDLFPERKDRLKIIELEGMVSVPQHYNYQQIIDGKWWNTYPPIKWVPKPGEWKMTYAFLEHIFGAQIEYGLDYLQLLLHAPEQKLPVLMLVSRERETGKSTFLYFLRELFGRNTSLLLSDDFEDDFNDHYINSLIVAIDETSIRRTKDLERIKGLCTGKKAYEHKRYFGRREVNPICHFVMCSNDISAAVLIDQEETRYWVIEVPPLSYKQDNILVYLKLEMPAFLHTLLYRNLSCPYNHDERLFFSPNILQTPALKRIVNATENRKRRDEKDMAEMLLGLLDRAHINEINMTFPDLAEAAANSPVTRHLNTQDIRAVIDQWGLATYNSSYTKYYDSGQLMRKPAIEKGRYYSFTRFLLEKVIGYETGLD